MSMENSHNQEGPFQRATSTAPLSPSPTRAYFSPSKSSITPTLSATLTASLATLATKKAYINLPSIQKVIAIHNSSKQDEANAPDYDETIANIPVLDLLPPPPVYDIVNCSTSQTLLLVSSLINTILAVNDRLACPKITLFHSRAIPNISIEAYLSRILQYAPFQNEVLLIILLYFDRIGGGCKPTQVLTNTIPKALLRQASMLPEADTKPKLEDEDGASQEKSTTRPERDMEEEEPIVDEIYTSSSESPVGSKLIINSFNIHRLLITSILVACKFSSDVFYPNVRYARVGGLPLSELNQLELEFLFLSQFELNTTESELQAYGNKLLMYHQRLNGTERAAFDSIGSPVKGEYPVMSEKKRTSIDARVQPSQPPQSPLQRGGSISDQKQRPPSGGFVASGPYRDSKEIPADNDDEEVMSEKTNDPTGSPRDWQFSGQSTPVVQSEVPEKYVHQRSKKMNLDHMIWPTNEMDTKYSASHFGAMVRDEDAARIEEEFNKASPPPEQSEPNPKRKLQRLSSGTLEATPAKRANTPGTSATSTEKSSASSNKNILRPLFKKIASFAGRSEAAPVPVPTPEVPQPALRSHPYLVRHRISPASSSTNLPSPENEEMTSPTTPVGHASPWHQDEYQQSKAPSFQMKPPPPYSGQGAIESQERSSRSTSNTTRRRQHRSREPSLSSLASELTFEPTRPSLSPMHEEGPSESHPSMAPFFFPPRPQQPRNPQLYSPENQTLNTPPATPMTKKSRPSGEPHPHDLDARPPATAGLSPTSNEDNDTEMQCDDDDDALVRRRPSESGDHDDEMGDTETSSLRRGSTNTNQGDHHHQQQETAGRQWQPPRTSAPVVQPVQYHHPHLPYVASYYPPNIQLIQDAKGGYQAFATTSPPHHPNHPQQYHPQQHPMVAIPRGMIPLQPAAPQYHPQQQSQQQQQQPSSQARTRQFAPIRPRTPMTMDDGPKGRAAPLTAEASSASSGKKKKDTKAPLRQTPLRPLVPNVGATAPSSSSSSSSAAAPPPYRPSFVAYPAPYAHTGGHPPPPMLMAVDYHGGPLSTGGHPVPPQFLAAGPPGAQGGPTRLFIPIIPVVYNKAPQPTPSPKTPKPSGLARIAPRLHRPS
ncbi:hypothetical protein BG006_001723 [Podila minutissima]|uniref:Cyclin-domain-containing protein n=1 Tax=Podila minutissima TaxID=64525 RepID=A0A9P5SRD7_9FUNG|nr:hypothetical protein BG006_001723 [Podila minutissima]